MTKVIVPASQKKNHLNDISAHNHMWHRQLMTHHQRIILTTHHLNQALEENAKCSLFLVLRRVPNSSQMLSLPPNDVKVIKQLRLLVL